MKLLRETIRKIIKETRVDGSDPVPDAFEEIIESPEFRDYMLELAQRMEWDKGGSDLTIADEALAQAREEIERKYSLDEYEIEELDNMLDDRMMAW